MLFLGQVENYRENTIYGFFNIRKHNILCLNVVS